MIAKWRFFVMAGIVLLSAGCQTSPPQTVTDSSVPSGLPQGMDDFINKFSGEGIFVGIGFAKDKSQREEYAHRDISRQLSLTVIFNSSLNWCSYYNDEWYDHSIAFVSSLSYSVLSSWLRENGISAKGEYSKGEWYAIAYEIPEDVRLRYPQPIMPVTTLFTIEQAVFSAAYDVSERLPGGSKIAVINISAADPDDSVFVIEELSTELVKKSKEAGKEYTMVDRRSLDAIRAEHKFQLSGDVSDDTIVSIGHFLGADVVITGSITGANEYRRLRVKALDVKTARLLIQKNLKY
jgi:hypothetical protein